MAGRPLAPTTISNNVFSVNSLKLFQCTPKEIYAKMNDKLTWLTWLAEHRLIRNANECVNCQAPMSLNRRAESPEGFSWKCRPCNTRTSVRSGSFFANCITNTETIVMIMYYWIYDVKSKNVMMFENVNNWHTMVNYNNFFRTECHNWLLRQPMLLGGIDNNGHPISVEIDESYFFNRKYHRGRFRRGTWVVGMVERETGRCWLEIVQRRDRITLEKIISAHILPGTILITDAWAGYNNIATMNNGVYMHDVVVHAYNFVDPIHSEIHTETIEGLWMQAKRKLRYQSGTSRNLFPSYLSAFQWRFSNKTFLFGCYLNLLSENYNI